MCGRHGFEICIGRWISEPWYVTTQPSLLEKHLEPSVHGTGGLLEH
jgi:hypothetical protein